LKSLSVLRHGKSTDTLSPAEDFRRPLTNGGRKRVKRAAKILNRMEPPIDLVVSSPAIRASETTTELCIFIGYQKRVLWQEKIYRAGAHDLLTILSNTPDEFEHVALIGHNPGLEQLISGLCAGVTDRNIVRLSTGSVAHVCLEIFRWEQIRWGCGELHLLANAKYLRKGPPKDGPSTTRDQAPANDV
jgi:phosphohistidine phosphatase